MRYIPSVLIANRGEIAVRIIKTAERLGIRTVAIYTPVDRQSLHVTLADKAVQLTGGDVSGYLNSAEILHICKEEEVVAVIPGYGFMSENSDFARAVTGAGMVWVGPSPDTIDSFGIKHTSRKLAQNAGVPIVPGTQDLIPDAISAIAAAAEIGYPIMLKATAGGGGMGLQVCQNDKDIERSFAAIVSRGQTLFKNAGVFMERYIAVSRHIEVQIFGNGLGEAVTFFERECSIQRRHQKVIEECPSPFLQRRPALRAKLGDAALQLAKAVKYKSAGTVEFLVDDSTGDFFFLEMNTRLQVEHGITEMCYNVDLVDLMFQQASAEYFIQGGIADLQKLQPEGPTGAAIELRLYAENPARNFAPAPGLLQDLIWSDKDVRVDTWIRKGTVISSYYDPLLAKLMAHSATREETIEKLINFSLDSVVAGPPTNIDFLRGILESQPFQDGDTTTNFLPHKFIYEPCAIDVLSGGPLTHIQDLPAWFGKRGVANILVGNDPRVEGLEITGEGPELRFLGDALVSICGADITILLDGEEKKTWESFVVQKGQRLAVGKIRGNGARAYFAIAGGLPQVPKFLGSKSTAIACNFGGLQGRRLAAGDLLFLEQRNLNDLQSQVKTLPSQLVPRYDSEWEIYTLPGPHDEGFLTTKGLEALYSTRWKISHNASRTGIAIVGVCPEFARRTGGEGGAHPSNVLEYGYPLGAVNWAGDAANILPVEGPDMGGFISTNTIIRAEFWRLGQVKPGDSIKFRRISMENAILLRKRVQSFIQHIQDVVQGEAYVANLEPLDMISPSDEYSPAILKKIGATAERPSITYRTAGDTYLMVEYGNQTSSLNIRGRVELLANEVNGWNDSKIIGCVPTHINLVVQYDNDLIDQKELLQLLVDAETRLADASKANLPSRIIRLPLVWNDSVVKQYIKNYMDTVRPTATYLPSNIDFLARNNGVTSQQVLDSFMKFSWICVSVCFYTAVPCIINLDPRQQLRSPKWNPPRTATPEGCVALGGISACLYNSVSPGGFQMVGRSIPGWDFFCVNKAYALGRPSLFRTFDRFEFYQVDETEYNKLLQDFHAGQYEYDIRDGTFDMREYNDFLDSIKDELVTVRQRQADASAILEKEEAALLVEWKQSKASAAQNVMNEVERLRNGESIVQRLVSDPRADLSPRKIPRSHRSIRL
ncbi:hypothetical protein D6D17_02142 [Aureobasidium pullulans]|nr:hypothetical protein D6D17_02142 [Aureobasidium pullulans]